MIFPKHLYASSQCYLVQLTRIFNCSLLLYPNIVITQWRQPGRSGELCGGGCLVALQLEQLQDSQDGIQVGLSAQRRVGLPAQRCVAASWGASHQVAACPSKLRQHGVGSGYIRGAGPWGCMTHTTGCCPTQGWLGEQPLYLRSWCAQAKRAGRQVNGGIRSWQRIQHRESQLRCRVHQHGELIA